MSQLVLLDSDHKERKTYFADIILPIPIPKVFTYRVLSEMVDSLGIGCRVVVPFGSRKVLTGVVSRIHEDPPKSYNAKYIIDQLELTPSINTHQLSFYFWLAEYYMCSIGEVMNCGLPSGLKINSESHIQINPDFETGKFTFSQEEQFVLSHLESVDNISYEDISKLLNKKNIASIVKSLVQKEAIILFEQLKDRYKPKIEKRIRLNQEIADDKTKIQTLYETLDSKPKQLDVIIKYLQEVSVLVDNTKNKSGLLKSALTSAGCSESSIKTLVKNGIMEPFELVISRFDTIEASPAPIILSDTQHNAFQELNESFNLHETVLLHGITGSGKTEIYIHLIQQAIENGGQVLYLLPEIALTTQIVSRLRKAFGSNFGVYHSRYSDNERVEVWNNLLSGKYQLVVGVRSSIFLPFDNLGLIIVDEEHESSYKQSEPAPRYHARDAALMLANQHHAKLLLGTASPSIESYYLAQSGKYGLVSLLKRYENTALPQIEIADISLEKKKKTAKGNFTSQLIESIQKTLSNNEQIIIFQNRRGYAPYLSCDICTWIPKCQNCAVSLTYHMYKNEMRCHYCGFREAVPQTCDACGSRNMKSINYGTEKLEEDLKLFFTDATVQRMDLDTTRGKHAYENIIKDFENHQSDILVGTQMVTKGLDFGNVNLVGVFDIDRMVHFPDFRASEKAFQITIQVAGRAGRKKKRGLVVIQTGNPNQRILQHIKSHDYTSFFDEEILERERYFYPPYARMIKIMIKNRDEDICIEACDYLFNLLRNKLDEKSLYGPIQPVINKIRNKYIREIYLKTKRGDGGLANIKNHVVYCANDTLNQKQHRATGIFFDVDPV